MWPGWLNFVLGFNTGLRELEVGSLEVWQWAEDVLLDHGHDIVQQWNNQANDRLLILEHLLDLVDGVKSLSLALDILLLILIVVGLLADQQFLLETLLGVLLGSGATSGTWGASGGRCLGTCSSCSRFTSFCFIWFHINLFVLCF